MIATTDTDTSEHSAEHPVDHHAFTSAEDIVAEALEHAGFDADEDRSDTSTEPDTSTSTDAAQPAGDAFDVVFDHSPIAMVVCDDAGRVLRVNEIATDVIGRPADEIVGAQLDDFVHLDDRSAVATGARRTDRAGTRTVARRFVRPDDTAVLLRCTESLLPALGDEPAHVLYQMIDVEALGDRTAQRIVTADTDPLTGLLSRRGLDAVLTETFDGEVVDTAAVLFIDLDHFKDVNYVHGPLVGDELLFEVARRLEGAVREHDRCARPGDDEFVVVCEDVQSFVDSYRVAERIRRAMNEPFELSVGTVTTSCSIGIASGWPGATPADVVASADAGRHHAKYLGRNRVEAGR